MPQNMKNVIHNSNSNDEIRKLCSKNNDLEIELKKSLHQPKKLIEDVFKELSLKGKKIEIFQAATWDKIDTCKNTLLNNLDENILTLSLRAILRNLSTQSYMDFTRNTLSAEPIISTYSNVLSSIVLGTNHLDMEKFHLLDNLYQKERLTAQ